MPSGPGRRPLSAAELSSRRRATRSSASGARTLVLVTENQASLFKVVRRHLDRHPISGQRLDPVLLHFAGRVGDDLVSGIELHAVACVGEDFGHQSFELDQLFLSYGYLQIDRRLAGSVGAVGFCIRTAFAMQKGDALHPFSLAAAWRRGRWTYRLMPVGLVPAGLRSATITTGTAATARPFRSGRGLACPGGVRARRGSAAPIL